MSIFIDADYPSLFAWAETSNASALRIRNAYYECLASAFSSLTNPEVSESVARMTDLPQGSIERILTAPDTFQRLKEACSGNIRGFNRFLQISIAVEESFLGGTLPLAKNRWSALGDYFDGQLSIPSNHDSICNSGTDRYFAPLLDGRVPVDAYSIFAHRSMTGGDAQQAEYGLSASYSAAEMNEIMNKLQETVRFMGQISPIAVKFVLENTSTVVVRNDAFNGGSFVSSSCNGFIGQIVLLNAHLSHVDSALLAESLIHETIHNVMLRMELLEPTLRDPSRPLPRVTSPWSGRQLSYHTFLQACFVWFGIASFWKAALGKDVFPTDRVGYLLERSSRGFKEDSLMSQLDVHSDCLIDGIREEFARLSYLAKSHFLEVAPSSGQLT